MNSYYTTNVIFTRKTHTFLLINNYWYLDRQFTQNIQVSANKEITSSWIPIIEIRNYTSL